LYCQLLLDDPVKVGTELLQGAARRDGLLDGAAQIGQQSALGGTGHDECPIVLGRIGIGPGAGWEIGLTSEEVDLLFERERAMGDRHSLPPCSKCQLTSSFGFSQLRHF